VNFHCLFEQSGTFKNMFRQFGHNAFDYDILNDYGQTDYQIDLFNEIETEYKNIALGKSKKTIFSQMKPSEDFIIAFFPCTYFTEQQEINFRLQNFGFINQKINNKFQLKHIEWLLSKVKLREYFFGIWIKFCWICEHKGIPTIIENPANINKRSYLELYSPYRPSFYERDRSNFGDDFVKPTNFFAINYEMNEQFEMFFDKNYNTKRIRQTPSKEISTGGRSAITSIYAKNFYNRFIKKYVDLKGKSNEYL